MRFELPLWTAVAALALCGPRPAAADSPLIEALRADDRPAALALLAKSSAINVSAAINARAADGSTALQWAVYDGEVDLVARLIQDGADVRAANDYGATPMSLAAAAADARIIELLLKAGADVESPNPYGQTALMLVARTDRVAAAQLLVAHGAHVNARESWRGQTALMWAAAQSQGEMVAFLLAHGANPNARSAVNDWKRTATAEARLQPRPAGGLTPLLYAARQGCIPCVRALARGNADLNLADPDGITPLLMATLNAHFDTAASLLQAGADPNRWDKWGRAPLYATVDYNTLPTGGRPDRPSSDATTPLTLIQQLLVAGANPNMQLKLLPPFRDLPQDRAGDHVLTVGTTPLIRAAKAGDVAVAKVLLAHGADVNLPNSIGVTPLHAAAGTGSTQLDTRGRSRTQGPCLETARLLVAAGADVSATDSSGRTPLYGAASWGWNDMIRFLIASGARTDSRDVAGFAPADAALGKGAGPVRFGITPEVHADTAALLQELSVTTAKSPTE